MPGWLHRDRYAVARKEHRCDVCGDRIRPGNRYAVVSIRDEDGWHRTKAHEDCLELDRFIDRYFLLQLNPPNLYEAMELPLYLGLLNNTDGQEEIDEIVAVVREQRPDLMDAMRRVLRGVEEHRQRQLEVGGL